MTNRADDMLQTFAVMPRRRASTTATSMVCLAARVSLAAMTLTDIANTTGKMLRPCYVHFQQNFWRKNITKI